MEVRDNCPPFILSAIYAIPKFNIRQLLWSSLYDIMCSIDMSWIVYGDFNKVTCQGEK